MLKQYFIIPSILLVFSGIAHSQGITERQLDSMATKAMRTFNVPGLSIAVVKDGKALFIKGYGLRTIKTGQKVDGNTLFGIASNSKAFTTAALGILVDEGKLKWDDKVIKYIPEFRMYDPYVTAEFTIRDLLTHRSGLAAGASDLMHNPDSANFTIQDIINNIQYLKPEASFRSRYAYDNIFYLVAGELVRRVGGMSWGDFIEKRIMAPLQMTDSRASYPRIKNNTNVIDGYHEVNGKLIAVTRTDSEIDAGAGGIYSSAADMGRWMLMHLKNGTYRTGRQLVSPAVHKDLWTPQVIIPASPGGEYHTHFGAYGLGWFLLDVKGYLQVFHTGGDDGMISEVAMLPELGLGITVLSNQEGGGAVLALVDQITDAYIGIKGTDRIKEYDEHVKRNAKKADTVTTQIWQQVAANKKAGKTVDLAAYTGTYHDNWFGDVKVYPVNGQLFFSSVRSLQMKGWLSFYKGDTFVIRWDLPNLANAFVSFKLDEQGRADGITLKSLTYAGGFDVEDLNFFRLK